jgi:hypothetical protein
VPLGYPLAMPLGGGPDDLEVAQDALLETFRPYLDPTDPAQIALTNAEALAIAMVWAINRRLEGILDPLRMVDVLPTWEQAAGLRPAPTDTDTDRRRALAAQFLGFVGNTIANLYAICQAIAGTAFLGFYLPSASAPTYTPGLNPGPPGWESTSCRAVIGVRLQPITLTDAGFLSTVRQLNRTLKSACPAWMSFVVGTDEGHAVVDVAVADRTLVMD